MVEHLDVSGVTSLMERSLQNPGTSPVRIHVGQVCCVPDDVFMFILIKTLERESLQYTPQLVKTVVNHESGIFETISFSGTLSDED